MCIEEDVEKASFGTEIKIFDELPDVDHIEKNFLAPIGLQHEKGEFSNTMISHKVVYYIGLISLN